MCTAVSYKVNDLYFGRTFDYEASYGEEIVFMPRKYPFNFRYAGNMQEHYRNGTHGREYSFIL